MTDAPNRILVVDNDKTICWVLQKALVDGGYTVEVATNGRDALDKVRSTRFTVVVMDVMMPVMDGLTALRRIREIHPCPETIIITAHSNMESTVEAMKLGAFDYVVKPFDIDDILALVGRAVDKYRQQQESSTPRVTIGSDMIIGDSPVMRDLYKILGRVASTDSSVLITGETGTGKDLFARAIHTHSARVEGPFITVNCASIPGELLESELFGHVKGAFTGATTDRAGKCEMADGGTLFLDEIGTMRLDLQAKLLRFLQRSEFERVGSVRTIHVNVRVVTATNADLKSLVEKGLFREDLYYRLMVVPVVMPPLRERKEDIPVLVHHFIDRYNVKYSMNFTVGADLLAILTAREWPGNVREMENYIHRLVVLQYDAPRVDDETVCHASDRHADGSLDALVRRLVGDGGDNLLDRAHEIVEQPLVSSVLAATGGNQSEAARRLGVSRNTLRKLITRYRLRD